MLLTGVPAPRVADRMSDRILRDEILTSERYWSVSIEAQRLFVHLLLVVDDSSRFSGKNYTIGLSCFPGHSISADKLEHLLMELVDRDLIRMYSINDERFLFVPRTRWRARYVNSKYPAPPNEIMDMPQRKSDLSRAEVILKPDSSPPSVAVAVAVAVPIAVAVAVPVAVAVDQTPNPKSLNAEPAASASLRVAKQEANARTWAAYAAAFRARYGVEPARNATTNTCIARFVSRVPMDDAPAVAEFFLQHNNRWYVEKGHATTSLLNDAEKLYAEWKGGRRITRHEAQHAEDGDSLRAVVDEVEARRAQRKLKNETE